jgi:flagellar FliL protein
MAKEEAKEEQVEKPKGGSKKLIIIILIAVIAIIGMGVGAVLLFMKPPEEGAQVEEKHEEDEHPPVYEKLEQFTVNLKEDEDGERSILQCKIDLKVFDASVQEKIKTKAPEIRDAVLNILMGKTRGEVSTPEGKVALATEIQTEINGIIGIKNAAEGVQKVMMPDYIIQ